MPVLAVPPFLQFEDENGLPLSGGLVYTYVAGTVNTPKATYTDNLGNVQASNPIVLDSAGRATIWIQGSYKFVVTKADGTVVKTTDNISSFNTIASAAASYFQSFSGDGSTTAFPLSQDLGTDENAIFVFVDNGAPTMIANGDFATDTIWTKGAGWTISGGVANAVASSTSISQTVLTNLPLVAGQPYVLQYTVTISSGNMTPLVGGTSATFRSTSGTYTEIVIAGSTQILSFPVSGFTGTLDNVSLKPVMSQGMQIIPPTKFTLVSGVSPSLVLATAPQSGTNNVLVFAPSSLVAAASASAAAAEAFANAANVSATLAAQQATSFTGTSTTSTLIGLGSKVFTTQTGKNFLSGEWVTVSSNAVPANYMYGQVSSYVSGTGVLTVNVTSVGGSGTYADWNIALSGIQGLAGGPVSNGTYGDITVTGGGLTWTVSNVSSTSDVIAGTIGKIVNAPSVAPLFYGTKVRVTAGQVITTLVAVNFANEDFDDDNWHDNVTNNSRITVNFTGRIAINASINGTTTGAAGDIVIELHKNGTMVTSRQWYNSGPNTGVGVGVEDVFTCVPTDYFEVKIVKGTGNYTLNANSTLTARRVK